MAPGLASQQLLDVPVRSPICCETACVVVHDLMKHYLYMLGQAPDLVDTLIKPVRSFLC